MTTTLFYPAPQEESSLVGLPHLMEMAFRDISLEPLGQELIERARHNPHDANALMDLSCIMFLKGFADLGRSIQTDALSISRLYTLPAKGVERLRLLVIMTPGSLMANMPIEFLLHGSDIALDMLYLDPDQGTSDLQLPPHDVACVGVCEAQTSRAMLEGLSQTMAHLPRPTLNDPLKILAMARECAWRALQEVPGSHMPPSCAVDRAWLVQLASGQAVLSEVLAGCASYPIICRPCGTHAGQGLAKIDDAAAMARYLAADASEQFVISPFVDYISPDRQYRKYRIAFVGGQPYPVHMALSARWMVHYLNGDMLGRADNRAAEQRFFETFDQDFGQRHAQAFAAIDARVGLDYYSIDCGETPDGRLLVFECDTGCVAHAMDPLEDFGYKRPHMLRLFAAFQSLLIRAAKDPACLKPKSTQAPVQ